MGPSLGQATPHPPINTESPPCSNSALPGSLLNDQVCRSGVVEEPGVLSLENFVYYVLRHSKMTCSMLSSALCYIKAIRNKVTGFERPIEGSPLPIEEEGSLQTRANHREDMPPVLTIPPVSVLPSPLLCPR